MTGPNRTGLFCKQYTIMLFITLKNSKSKKIHQKITIRLMTVF